MKRLALLLLVTACSHVETQWQNNQFYESGNIIKRATPKAWRKQCGYEREPEKPKVQILEESSHVAGLFSQSSETVYYKKSDYTALIHEYIHYRNFKANASYSCLDELTAYLAEEVAYLEEYNKRLRNARRN